MFSLYFDKNDIISFALTSTVEHTDNGYDEINPIGVSRSDNEFYMVGIGYSYRSLDFISAEFNILEYMGAVKITAIDNIEVHYWDNNYNALTGLTIPAGETKWIFYDFFSLQFVLAINPLPWVSIKTKVAININLSTISKPNFGTYYYSRDLNTLLLNFFQIGMAFKI